MGIVVIVLVCLVLLGLVYAVARHRAASSSASGPTGSAERTTPVNVRRPPRGQICDFCNADGVACTYSAATVREAARCGFRPDFSGFASAMSALAPELDKNYFERNWLEQVQRDSTDWASCGVCANQLDRRLR